MEWRQAILTVARVSGDLAAGAGARRALVAQVGEDAVLDGAERAGTLHQIDRAWRDHLALVADVREGDSPGRARRTAIRSAFHGGDHDGVRHAGAPIEQAVLGGAGAGAATDSGSTSTRAGLKGPSSTWTYLVNDDPFRNQIGMMLTGPGSATFAIGAAALAMPLLILWG